jgi:hypothetical protein
MWRTPEPYHGLVYFAPEAADAYARFGITGRDGYFASRAAPMGRVPAEVVVATFFNFNPEVVHRSIPSAWDLATPAQLVEARLVGIDAALRRTVGPLLDDPDVDRAAHLAREAAQGCSLPGRPLHAGHASLAWPDAPHLALWHAITLLREYRGDGHVAALVDAGLSGLEALVLHAASGEVPRVALQTTRGWTDDDWQAAVAGLAGRDLLDHDGGFTETGAALRRHIEDRTDAMALAPWEALGQAGCDELRALVRPLSRAIVAGGSLGIDPTAATPPP